MKIFSRGRTSFRHHDVGASPAGVLPATPERKPRSPRSVKSRTSRADPVVPNRCSHIATSSSSECVPSKSSNTHASLSESRRNVPLR